MSDSTRVFAGTNPVPAASELASRGDINTVTTVSVVILIREAEELRYLCATPNGCQRITRNLT